MTVTAGHMLEGEDKTYPFCTSSTLMLNLINTFSPGYGNAVTARARLEQVSSKIRAGLEQG